MFFSSINKINRLLKETNGLLNKGMSNIYLEITIEKKLHTQNFNFQRLKNSSPGQCFGSSNSCRYHWTLKLLFATCESEASEQNCVWLFYYFSFERNCDALNSKSNAFCRTKIQTLIKMRRNRKWEIPRTVLQRRILCFRSYKNCESKVKL